MSVVFFLPSAQYEEIDLSPIPVRRDKVGNCVYKAVPSARIGCIVQENTLRLREGGPLAVEGTDGKMVKFATERQVKFAQSASEVVLTHSEVLRTAQS